MKIVITESQLKTLINEQQIKVDLVQNSHLIDKHCKPYKVNKAIIDKNVGMVDDFINERLIKMKENYYKKFPSAKGFIDIDDLILKSVPILSNIVKNQLYHSYGYIEYNKKNDVNLLMKTVYDDLYGKLMNSGIKKMLFKNLVTPKNIKSTKEMVGTIFNIFMDNLRRIENFTRVTIEIKIRREYLRAAPKCMEVIVVRDESYNWLPKEKQYNPKSPIYYVEQMEVSFDNTINFYKGKINAILDSFV